ncbi:MAG: hypothetical protein HY865_17035 [Chloroflexi bacterium]|nr:hypothetical protein [Chloroflexota bacterium]
MDMISQILQAIGYLLLLVILALLWRKAFRQSEARPFWRLLAMAWTMNLLGNIAWVIHDLVTETTLDTFSAVDLFYVLRYVLIGIALWLYPTPLTRRDGVWIGVAVFVTNAIVWAVYFNPAMELRGGDWTGFLGLAMYPALDAAMIMLAWLRVRAAREGLWNRNALLLFYAMACYGIANTINLTGYVFSLAFGGVLSNVFWILTDIFVLSMALGDSSAKKSKE